MQDSDMKDKSGECLNSNNPIPGDLLCKLIQALVTGCCHF